MAVFVLDRHKKPLAPCTERRARILLEKRRARVYRMVPFTIRLIDRLVQDSIVPELKLKIDPGSKATGLALNRVDNYGEHVVWLGELRHRGAAIREKLTQRRAFRRRRRNANLRYRAPRFNNRRKPKGWLVPSLQHRVDGVANLVSKIGRVTPVACLTVEIVRFDMQLMQNSEISGVEYQQGTLAGYEVREYLLEKWGRKCAYCGITGMPLQIDHIEPKSCGGSNRISNLTLACAKCNAAKSNRPVEEFLSENPQLRKQILAQAKTPLRDAAVVNSTRKAICQVLQQTGLAVATSTGGRTKWNRVRFGIPKSHALDAACVGQVDTVTGWQKPVCGIKSMGRGAYQRTQLNAFGFPRGYLMHAKSVFGFQTGDLVEALVPKGKYQGKHIGRVAIRERGSFVVKTAFHTVDVSYKHCGLVQRADGYQYF